MNPATDASFVLQDLIESATAVLATFSQSVDIDKIEPLECGCQAVEKVVLRALRDALAAVEDFADGNPLTISIDYEPPTCRDAS